MLRIRIPIIINNFLKSESNVMIMLLIMFILLFALFAIHNLSMLIYYGIRQLWRRHRIEGRLIWHYLRNLCLSSGLLLLCLGLAMKTQLVTNALALSNPETSIAAHKPKFKKEKIKPLAPKTQLKAQQMHLESIGTLLIPHVKLKLPIFNSLTNVTLARGACVMAANMRMGRSNFALAGHYLTAKGALFSPIANCKKGDLIYVSSASHKYTYRVYLNKIIPPTATWVLKPTKKKRITLVTCADDGAKRYLVRGKLVKAQRLHQQ